MINKFESIFNKTIIVLLLGFTFLSLIGTLTYAQKNQNNAENILLVLFPTLLIFLFVFLGFKLINKIAEKNLKFFVLLCFAVFAVCELFFIVNFSSVPTTDSYRCIDTAIGFVNGDNPFLDESDIYYNYFCHYSNNNMFIFILYGYFSFLKLFGVTDFLFFARLLNAVFILISVVFAYLSVKLLFSKRFAAKAMLIFTLNPSLYFHIEWVYTLTFSLAFMTAILYFCLAAKKAKSLPKRIAFCVAAAVLSAIGYLIRPTSIFPIIAFAVILIVKFKFNKDYITKFFACAASFLLVFVINFVPISAKVNERFESTLKYNLPITHWLMMGLNRSGKLNYDDVDFTVNLGDSKSEKIKGNLAEINKRVSDMGFFGLVENFARKTLATFSDGTHHISVRMNFQQRYTPAYNYINGENNHLFVLYCQGFRAFTYLLMMISLVSLFFSKQKCSLLMPVILTSLGGFVFYLLWEAKQAYSLPFTLFFLIIAACSMDEVEEKIKFSKTFSLKKPVNIAFTAVLTALLVLSGGFNMNYLKNLPTENKTVDYSLNYFHFKFAKPMPANLISQEFYSDKSFNFVCFLVYKDRNFYKFKKENGTIDFKIKNAENITVASKKVSSADYETQKKNYAVYKIDFPRALNNKYRKFTFYIDCGKNETPLNFAVSRSVSIDAYKGNLKISDKTVNSDSLAVVGNQF